MKILRKIKNIMAEIAYIPWISWVNILVLYAWAKKRPAMLIEITTSHDIFCIDKVIKEFYDWNAFIIYSSKDVMKETLLEQIQKEFNQKKTVWINVAWTNFLVKIDFYINTTLSYDIHVPSRARYKINFPHTITSKTKYDVFSPAISKITDTIITGKIYEQDMLTYCQDHNIEKIPKIHRLGGPKSDKLFTLKIDKREFTKKLELDPELPTIFYGPTYNQNTSIYTWIDDILKITKKNKVNLIIKAHPGIYLDPKSKKGSGGINWKEFFSKENLRKKRIFNVINQDSIEFIMASDICITDISTLWIEFYFLRKKIIFLDIPEFFKTHKMNSLGDFREKYGYLVKNVQELNQTIAKMISGNMPQKTVYDIDDLLLYNKGRASEMAVDKIKELFKFKSQK